MAAPKGNQFSYNGGRPPMYDSPEEMWNKAVEFFEASKTSTGVYKPTIEGLTFYLGFSSRQSLINYAKKNEVFLDTVDRMKQFIKACYEKNLYSFTWAGASFALRNLGKEDWKDEITEHQNQTVTNVTITEKQRES